jgi:hypothetical protein
MKNKLDALTALSAAGWTSTEIESVLGNIPELDTPLESGVTLPWWAFINDRYADGNPLIEAWHNWLARGKPI